MIFFLLIFMFFLGIVQVLWAIIQGLATRQPLVRKHFLIYGGGVLTYFSLMLVLTQIGTYDWEIPLIATHFFGGAFALAAYHVWILALSIRLRNAEEPREYWV